VAVRRSRRGRSTAGFGVDVGSLDLFIEQLRTVPKEAKKDVRKAIVAATSEIRADMARRASWSSRIPGAITTRVRFASASVQIRVDARRAPHARPYEGVSSRGGSFRHPVYGNTDRWVSQAARPFFFPAAEGHRKAVRDAVERAVFQSFPR
jgi:hypothetical protein